MHFQICRHLLRQAAAAKTLLVMRITILLVLVATLQVRATGYGQTVTMSVKHARLTDVFTQITAQTGYTFLFLNATLDNAKPVSVDVANMPLDKVLEACFKEQPFDYQVNTSDKVIVLKNKAVTAGNFAGTPPPTPPVLRGKVTNEKGEPLSNITVAIQGTKRVTQTANDGSFSFTDVDKNAVLVFSGVNVETQEVGVGSRTELTISMVQKVGKLDEVQIIAYGTQTQRNSTGNVSIVSSKEIERQPVNNALLALEGRVPGLFVAQATGYSGSGVTSLIEGRNSINKSNDPFFVVDGVPYISQLLPNYGTVLGGSNTGPGSFGSPLAFINPSDIESISVLKDADATAIYGSRAANGAILITTKKGRAGQTKFDLNVQQGWGQLTRFLKLMNTQQYVAMRKEAFRNDNVAMTTANAYDLLMFDTTRYTDWQKALLGGTARYTNADASISGGNKNTQFLAGATYHRETTVFPADFADTKGSVHVNINTASDNQRFKMQLSALYMVDNNRNPNDDLTSRARLIAPDAPALYNDDGTINWLPDATGTSRFTNPVASFLNKYNNKTSNLVSNLTASYQIMPYLQLKSSFGYTNLQSDETVAVPLTSTKPENRASTPRSASYANNNINSWTVEPQLLYSQSFNHLKIDGLVGFSIQQTNSNGQQLFGSGYNSDAVLEDIKSASSITVQSTTQSKYRYNAGFTRISLAWDNKYLLNLSGRRDGTSRFGPESRFHNFGAAGIGWIFSKEGFLSNLGALSFGKIRASYGTSGNDQIGDYQYLDLYSPLPAIGVTYQGAVGYAPNNIPNPNLHWEETKKFDAGLDLGFLQDRILLGVGYYLNRSSDQLTLYALPSLAGFANVNQNNPAIVQNTGIEGTLHTVNFRTKNFSWTTDFNITFASNKLVRYDNLAKTSDASRLVVGKPTTISKVYHYLGIDPATGAILFQDFRGNPTATPDNATDRYVVINTAPTIFGGLENSFQYKGLELDFLFQFVKRNGSNYSFGGNNTGLLNFNQPKSVEDRWRKPGDITSNTKTNTTGSNSTAFNNALNSDAGITDASFVRLKNIALSWQLPASWKARMKLRTARLYVQGQNLLTITSYTGFDPETLSQSTLPPLSVLTVGLQIGL